MFRFKQFAIQDDRCAQKVGTDGVLLGAWARVEEARNILDIGAGSGLIALMVAQRSKAIITAVDLDADAVEQAKENVLRSPWSDRIEVIHQDVREFSVDVRFDGIVSNPPYFVDNLKSPDHQRALARHTDNLSFRELLRSVDSLLSDDGLFSVILPSEALDSFWSLALEFKLYPCRQAEIMTKASSPVKRVMLELRRKSGGYISEWIALRDASGALKL